MSDSYIDQDLAIAIATGAVAAIYLALGVWYLWNKRVGVGLARLFAGALFGFVAFFLATFTMRLF